MFNPLPIRPWRTNQLVEARVGKVVSEIGEKAGVKVNTEAHTGRVKYASAHDLRRSFGERWAVQVMPQVLKELMRHESIETTMKYYVGRNAETTAAALYQALPPRGATTGDTCQNPADPPAQENAETAAE